MQYFIKKWVCSFVPVVLIAMISGCDDKDEIQQVVKLTVEPETLSVESAGGEFKVNYVLDGTTAGEKPQIKCDEAWINSFDITGKGEISFCVDANEEETQREAKIELTYRDVQSDVTVTQAGAPHIPGLTVEIKEIYDAGVMYSIVPEDAEMTYISMVAEKSYFDSFESDEAFFNDELKYFEAKAEASKLQLSEYLATIFKKGEVTGTAYRLKPEQDYYIYAYGMASDGARLTEIFKKEFHTIPVERSDVELSIDYEIKGTTVTMTVTPSDPNQLYIFNALSASEVSGSDDLLNAAQSEIDQYIEYYEKLFGVPQDEAVKRFASSGVASYTFEDLPADTEYVGYAVAVNRLGSICADVVSKNFKTENEIPDDIITLTLTNLTDREVTVQTTTTISDHYVIGVDNTARWSGMTDKEIVDKLVAGYQWQAKGGEGNGSYTFYSLMPQTDYSIFAFGYVDGVATTGLCRYDFTTKGASKVDIVFKMIYDKYYDGDEMALTYGDERYGEAKGKAVFPVRFETEGSDECAEIYYLFFDGDYSAATKYSDDYFMEDLLEYGDWRYNNCFYPEYDKPYTMIGFGATNDMAMGPVSRQVVTLSRDGVSPASEYSNAPAMNIYKGKSLRNNPKKMSLTTQLPQPSNIMSNKVTQRTMPYKAKVSPKHDHRYIIR